MGKEKQNQNEFHFAAVVLCSNTWQEVETEPLRVCIGVRKHQCPSLFCSARDKVQFLRRTHWVLWGVSRPTACRKKMFVYNSRCNCVVLHTRKIAKISSDSSISKYTPCPRHHYRKLKRRSRYRLHIATSHHLRQQLRKQTLRRVNKTHVPQFYNAITIRNRDNLLHGWCSHRSRPVPPRTRSAHRRPAPRLER